MVNRFSSLFSRKPLHLGPGVEQFPLLGFDNLFGFV
jgi:hypothetical protein